MNARRMCFWTAGLACVAVIVAAAAASPRFVDEKEQSSRDQSRATAAPKDRSHARGEAPLIVHEWGTFTSFSGSDGFRLEFRPLVENDLPPFVHDRAKQSGMWLGKFSIFALQRMETPVTYFYTPVERDVQVRVRFPEGLLTEFYPPVRRMEPPVEGFAVAQQESRITTAPPLENSVLDWGTVHLIPTSRLAAQVADPELARRIGRHVEKEIVPQASNDNHYVYARETESAIVQVRFPDSKLDYFEKFLFYRGVGNFESPLTVESLDEDRFRITSQSKDEIRSLFLVTVRGDVLRYARREALAAGAALEITQVARSSTLEELSRDVVAALVAEGLYEDEARAMVKTWSSSWFGEHGTRLFYVVPRDLTDRLLPLEIEPRPDEVVRVLVGRVETMTPAAEERLVGLVQRSAAARGQAGAVAGPVIDELLALGRLAEPGLVRVGAITDEPAMRDEARKLMQELRVRYKATHQKTGG